MHPELPDVLQNASTEPAATQFSPASSQHGLDSPDQPLRPLLSASSTGGDAGRASAVGGRVRAASGHDALESPRLNKPSPPPRNRIAEYENALSPMPQNKIDGPAFDVVNKRRKAGDKSSAIAKLPNEILTHALSHLPPNDLSAVALVSRRFHALVTTPHAWRIAFARYFPGPDSLLSTSDYLASDDAEDSLRSDRRAFARLTALASWRSEYILRTRLLRSLSRGKPMSLPNSSANTRSSASQTPGAITMYNSHLFTTVNHLHATFGTGLNKRLPAFIHGADDTGMASMSEPSTGKTGSWGTSDPQFFLQFYERHAGEAQWGLGPGNMVGNPNVMDVSQPHGMVHGEGSPGGSIYYQSTDEMRGRYLALPLELNSPELGIPRLLSTTETVCSVWIAKSSSIPSLTDGLVGIMSGTSSGVVTVYSLGNDGLRDSHLGRGELAARWVLSPGVPIIALAVDDSYSPKRQAQNRLWCVALNALGEVFYLTKFPKRPSVAPGARLDEAALERLAWATGRSVYWNIIEPSRRDARPDPYRNDDIDGSYSPRSSWKGMCLSQEQIKAETKEIEDFLRKKPIDFRKSCLGWDMRRKMEVDFAGDDGNYAGEAIVVFECGLDEDSVASAQRFTRLKVPAKEESEHMLERLIEAAKPTKSLFGGPDVSSKPPTPTRQRQSPIQSSGNASPERPELVEEWRTSKLSFDGAKSVQITTISLDVSTYATMTLSEDPIFGFSGASTASSPFASPLSEQSQQAATAVDVPGQRTRFIGAGTQTGSIFLWDIRAPVARNAELVNTIDPVRIIHTDSPQISCLAMTALYLVHGGNDGLVQAWDPLASSMQPIRTLNSRFSSRARRRLVQAQASAEGVGINLFAAGAICLDPDPTVLRGMVSLGTHLRFWSYSSNAADQYKSSKRRLRRSERGSNNGGEGPRFSASGRSKVKDYIAQEQYDLERDKLQRQREADRLAGRFGVDLIEDEEQALAYAALLSEESLASEAARRQSETSSVFSETATIPATMTPSSSPPLKNDEELDADIAEAIRLSLQEDAGAPRVFADNPAPPGPTESRFDMPIKYAKTWKLSPASASASSCGRCPMPDAGSSGDKEMDELEFALQLSLAEERSRMEEAGSDEEGGVALGAGAEAEEFPALSAVPGAKGKRRAW